MGFKTLDEVNQLTFYEYELLLEAYRWREFDSYEKMHYQAWINEEVKATKTTGSAKKPKTERIYQKFDKFFNREKQMKALGLSTKTVDNKIDEQRQRALFLAKQNRKKGD